MSNTSLIRAFTFHMMALIPVVVSQKAHAQVTATPAEARSITEEAFIYANPLADS